MSVWGRIFAACYDRVMEGTEKACLRAHREALIANAHGQVLEIGGGTGANLGFYSDRVQKLTVTEPEAPMAKRLARHLKERELPAQLVQAPAEELPFEDQSFDVVISNGVINLSPVKSRVFAEVARVLKPGGRLALADIVSGRPLKERTRRDVDLWAACIAGAIPRRSYVDASEGAGLRVREVRENPYNFISDRALQACSTYGVESVSLLAVKD